LFTDKRASSNKGSRPGLRLHSFFNVGRDEWLELLLVFVLITVVFFLLILASWRFLRLIILRLPIAWCTRLKFVIACLLVESDILRKLIALPLQNVELALHLFAIYFV
jgi:hypothetical protein